MDGIYNNKITISESRLVTYNIKFYVVRETEIW
jgi:hypothetical protein